MVATTAGQPVMGGGVQAARRARRKGRGEDVCFDRVEEGHLAVHARLENWGRWCHGGRQYVWRSSPMFAMYQSPAWAREEYGRSAGVPVDAVDAAQMAKRVRELPALHRAAINWYYVKPTSPGRAARELGTTLAGLDRLVRDGRTMLVNQGA